MKWAFYKNWKKMALVLTSMFWASCGDDASSTAPETSSESSSSVEASSSDSAAPSSSNAVPASSANEFAFSSEEVKSSSSVTPASSSTPASSANESSSSVNPENLIACVDTTLDRMSGNQTYKNKGVACADGENYLVDEMCPLYGVGLSCSRRYTDDNGTTYSEDEFQNIYKIVKELPNSSSSAVPASSSSEKIACAKATLERYEGLPCDGEICPDYGVVFTEVEGIKCEDGEEYELESICPDYGIPAEPCSDTYFGKNGKVYSAEEFKKIYEIDSRQ